MGNYITIQGHQIYYIEYGSGIPVFNIHGYEVDHRMMTGALEPIFEQKKGYRRIYIDLPGFGKTSSNKEALKNTDEWLSLLNEIIDTLIGKEQKFILTGQSYGCYLMLGLLLERGNQIDGTLFIAPCTIANRKERDLPIKAVVEEDYEFSKGMTPEDYDLLAGWSCIINKASWRIFERDMKPGIDCQDLEYVNWFMKNGYESANQDKFLSVTHNAPSCWITGRQDHLVGYKDTVPFIDNFDRATYVCLDVASHNVHIEKRDFFNLLVVDWLDRINYFLS